MIRLTIDNIPVEVKEGSTILEAATAAGIPIPTLCYLKDLNEIGACRVCLVEIEGIRKLAASCNTPAVDGMVVHTNSKRVRATRRINVQLLLSEHDCHCPTCVRSGNCSLQSLANDLNIIRQPYEQKVNKARWNYDLPLIRESGKCIKCMRCVQVCDKIQKLNVWDIVGVGDRITVGVSGGKKLNESNCSLCGQCITHCPVGALRERDDTVTVMEAICNPDLITVVQVAPAVRAAWGESFGMPQEKATIERMAAGLRKLGFDYVFDTNFAADLTIMEEGSELVEHLTHRDEHKWPMFTSCCPGWVRFLKSEYPDMVGNLSTAKSPQQMFGAVTKSYFAEKIGVDPKKIFCVSVMPCTAKKHECAVPVFRDACGDPDVDIVLTTREMNRMFAADHIRPNELDEEALDNPLGIGTGAAVIFGAQAGVMEAALRSAYFLVTGENPKADAFKDIRGWKQGWTEAVYEIAGIPVRIAVASGLKNTRSLIEAIRRGEVEYDFVEIMACPGGCAGGGGQPIREGSELAGIRGNTLYRLDHKATLRFSHENPSVQKLYEEYLEKPLSHRAHELLHTDHEAWTFDELSYVNPEK